MNSKEFRQERYRRSFFKCLVKVICRRCGISRANGKELLSEARSVTQYEMWIAIQEMLDWLERQGRPFPFSRRAFYYGTSQLVPLNDLVGDLMEISALRTGHRYGIYARQHEHFPVLENEKGIARAVLEGFFARLFEGYDFGIAFSVFEPETPLAVWLDILYGHDCEVVFEGYKTVRQRITFRAMSMLIEGFLSLFSLEQFRRACLFLRERVAKSDTRITEEHARRWIADYYCAEANTRAMTN